MSEITGTPFGLELDSAGNFCERISGGKIFEIRPFVEEELRSNGASSQFLELTKDILLRQRDLRDLESSDPVAMYKDYRSNFLRPINQYFNSDNPLDTKNLDNLDNLATLWYSTYYCFSRASLAAKHYAKEDFSLVSLRDWTHDGVGKKLEQFGCNGDDEAVDILMEYLINPDNYHGYIQWHSYSYSLSLGVLEEVLSQFLKQTDISNNEGTAVTRSGLVIEHLQRANMERVFLFLDSRGLESAVTKKAISRAFAYDADSRRVATANINGLLGFNPIKPA